MCEPGTGYRSGNGKKQQWVYTILPGINFLEYGLYGTSIRRRSRCRAVPPVRGVGAAVDAVVVGGVVSGSGGGLFERNMEGGGGVVVVEASNRNALLTAEACLPASTLCCRVRVLGWAGERLAR